MTISCAQLVRGQENLDRMKREIDFIIKLCLNLLEKNEFLPGSARGITEGDMAYPEGGTVWGIHSFKEGVSIHFFWRNPTSQVVYDFNAWQRISPPAHIVQRMHEELPVFLRGMIDRFPPLEKRLLPYVEAAKVAF